MEKYWPIRTIQIEIETIIMEVFLKIPNKLDIWENNEIDKSKKTIQTPNTSDTTSKEVAMILIFE